MTYIEGFNHYFDFIAPWLLLASALMLLVHLKRLNKANKELEKFKKEQINWRASWTE